MSEIKSGDDKFLKELEDGIRTILKNRKSTGADRLGAINAGVRLAAIKHRIAGSGPDEDKGFFDK